MSQSERVRVLFCDHLNLARGKYIPGSRAESGETRYSSGTFAVDYDRCLVDAPGSGMREGLPDIRAVFKPEDARLGWEPNTRVVVADLYKDDRPFGLCTRAALRCAVEQWEQHGLSPHVGIELEGFVFQRNSMGDWEPYHTPGAYVYGTGTPVDPEGLLDDIWNTAARSGFAVEAINSEYDWPQFEFTLPYRPAIEALDNAFLFRIMAREVLAKRGYLLTFMPKPLSDRSGSGLHINISFIDDAGNNACADPDTEDGLSTLTRQCIAGLMHRHRSMAALLAPTVNSYRRLRPASLAGYWANWGYDHRGTTVRIPGERGERTRIEHRVADGAANPYVATATVLQAARLGVENNYKLQPPETGDGLERVDTNICVPETLGAAIDVLEADKDLVAAVGELLVGNFASIKRKEWNDFLAATTDWEMAHYLEFI